MVPGDPLNSEIEQLRIRLAEALEALEAIRSGQVDALVVYQDGVEQIYTMQGADQPYRVMVEAMNEGAATLSSDGLILWGNLYLAEMLKSPLQSLLGTSLFTHLAPESRPAFETLLAHTPPAGDKIEVELLDPAGNRVPVLLSVSPLKSPSHSANLCLVFTDLTEQKRSLEIAAAERMAAAIIEQAVEPMVVCDKEGRVIRASRSAFELAAQNPLSRPFDEVFPLSFDVPAQPSLIRESAKPDGQPFSISAVLKGAVIHGVEASIERGLPGEPAKTLNLNVSAAPLFFSEDGRIGGCVITMTNQTERKQAEEQVRRYAKQLESSNKDLQDFAFIASHDLQEPLRKIHAFSARLLEKYGEQLDADGRDYLERMQNAEERMRKMIEELLTYSRVATKAQPFAKVDLNQVCKEVLSDLEVRLKQTGGRVEVEKLPVIEADPVQMRQLLQNLLSNSLKFYREDVPPVVRVCAKTKGRSQVEISVADNGIGFSMEYVDVIFEPFRRLHGRSNYEGSGVGLAICRRIVERHNGQITATSEPDQGAVFVITLPVQQDKNKKGAIP
ncbi:MAG TPA: ATP-binding protein [Anaerolineaceae bacterium]|nr:ATP-binding protein [Anaerolineaceae bacterium]